jgi:hypothetical protein
VKRISWTTVALVVVLGAAFLVQASSTWRLGLRQHLADLALPALVVLLEVGAITTASIFFRARSKGLRRRALLLLAICAGTGGMGGIIAYGWVVGLVVAILMLGLVEIVGAYRHEQVDQPSTTLDQPSTTLDQGPVEERSRWVDVPLVERGPATPSPPVDNRVDQHRAPFVDPAPTEPMPRLPDTRAVDPLPEEPPVEEPDESWREHTPDEAEYAAVVIDHPDRDGRRHSERTVEAALLALGFPAKGARYRAKKYLGNATRRLEAVG